MIQNCKLYHMMLLNKAFKKAKELYSNFLFTLLTLVLLICSRHINSGNIDVNYKKLAVFKLLFFQMYTETN